MTDWSVSKLKEERSAENGRRKRARSTQRREQKTHRQQEILAAALEVFGARGFEAARIEEVARLAGIAKGTVYLYFPDKEKLFQAVVRELIPRRLDLLLARLSGSPPVLLQALLSQIYANVVRNPKVPSIVRMLVAESDRFPRLAEIYHQEVIERGMKAMRKVLTQGVAEGAFGTTKAIEFPQLIAGPALLAMVWQLLFGKQHPLDLDAYMKAHTEFVLRSLRPQRQ
jgi:AcrR family transcriptional regulator